MQDTHSVGQRRQRPGARTATHQALIQRAVILVVVGAVHGAVAHGDDPRALLAPCRPGCLLPGNQRESVTGPGGPLASPDTGSCSSPAGPSPATGTAPRPAAVRISGRSRPQWRRRRCAQGQHPSWKERPAVSACLGRGLEPSSAGPWEQATRGHLRGPAQPGHKGCKASPPEEALLCASDACPHGTGRDPQSPGEPRMAWELARLPQRL